MNPFKTKPVSQMQQMMGFAKQVQQIMRNPSSIADVLKEKGAVDEKTYEAIRGMNPSQIGNYMIENGLMDGQQAQSVYQTAVPQIQGLMK